VAAGLVLYRIDISLWYDETFSYGVSTQPWHTFLGHYLWGVEANMALYYAVLRGWLWLTGVLGLNPVEVIVRLPSAVFAIAATVVLYLLGKRLGGWVAGAIAAGLYATNFLQLIVAQSARSYSLQLLLLGLSWYCLLAALDGGPHQRRWWVGYVASSTLAVYAALFSGLVLTAQVVAIAFMLLWPGPWQARVRAALRPFVASLVLIGVLLVPIAVDAAVHGGPNDWIRPAHFGDIRTFFLFISGNSIWYERLVIATGVLAGLLAIFSWARPQLASRVTTANPESLASVIALSCWLVVPIVLSFALTRPGLNLHLFFHRYLIVVVPAICLLVGLGVSALRWRAVQLVLAVLLAVVAVPQVPQYYKAAKVQEFHQPTLWIQQRYQPGDGLICDPVVQCGVPMSYYLAAYPGPAHFDPDSPGRFIWENTSWVPVDIDRVLAYAAAHRRVFLIFAPIGNGTAAADEAKALESSLSQRYAEIDRVTAQAPAVDCSVFLYRVNP
jgi:uncharacterized membrane protein